MSTVYQSTSEIYGLITEKYIGSGTGHSDFLRKPYSVSADAKILLGIHYDSIVKNVITLISLTYLWIKCPLYAGISLS